VDPGPPVPRVDDVRPPGPDEPRGLPGDPWRPPARSAGNDRRGRWYPVGERPAILETADRLLVTEAPQPAHAIDDAGLHPTEGHPADKVEESEGRGIHDRSLRPGFEG